MTQQLSPANILVALRDVCAALYPEERDARVIVADAGLDERQIAFSARAETNWHAIWLEAIRQDQVDTLLAVIQERYSTNPALQAALTGYQHFLATGGRLNAQALLTATDDAPAPGDPPYQGMAYYDVTDADRFFGREALTAELVDHLRHNNLLAVVGASGSGKSSLVRAGVLPALQGKQPLIDGKQPPTGSARWAYYLITPTAHPLKMLAASLTPANESILAQAQLMDALHVEPRTLDLYAHRLVKGDQRLLLVVDQFEELFTLCKDEGEQQAFVDNLLHAATDDGVVTLVLTLRADFYHHCARFPDLRTALERQQKYIGAMSRDELRRAIEEPAKAGEWELQAGLVEQLLQDVGDEPGALPLLSHALLETWQRRRGRTLTLAGYRAAGGVQGAIAKTADDVFKRFTDEQKTIARIIFLRLTELGEGVQDTRRRVRPAELKLPHANPDAVQQVLKTLADARLVTTAEDEVQVAHEALIRHWATLRAWLDDDREGLRIHRRLTEAANQWIEFGKEPTLLYRGVLLQQAQEWQQNTIVPPNEREMTFLQASQDAAAAEVKRAADLVAERERNHQRELLSQRQRTRLLRNAALIAGLLFALAVVAAGVSFILNGQLQQTSFEALRLANIAFSRQLAAQSTSELDKGQYESAILLALAAGQITDTSEAFTAIRAAIANPGHSCLVFYGHTGAVYQATWNQDESKILTASQDGTARIWDATTGQELLRLVVYTASVTQATWSQDESKILTNSADGTVGIWNAVTGQELVRLNSHTTSVTQASWNKDESKILTSSDDGSARIWDATTGKEMVRLDKIAQAVWNQDGRKILTVSTDGTTSLWDVTMGQEMIKFEGHVGTVTQAVWNQDESKILTISTADGTVRVWDAATGQELVKLEGYMASVTKATWNHDESKILVGGADGTAGLWDATTGQELVKFAKHVGAVTQAVWNQDGRKVLTVSTDGTAHIWNVATGQELIKLGGHTVRVIQATWNQDEGKILTSSYGSAIRIWDAVTGQELVKLIGHTASVTKATWNQDGSKVLTSSDDGTVRIWDTTTNQELIKLVGHTDTVTRPAWNQDGSKILTAGGDGNAHIWNAVTGQELVKLGGQTGAISQATWSKDERKILIVSSDPFATGNFVSIWDIATGQELLEFGEQTSTVTRATWNQDESKILIHSGDGSARVWDATTGQEIARLEGHTSFVYSAIWNQDESKILTNSGDGTVRIWNATTGQELIKFEKHPGAILQAVWNQDDSKILIVGPDVFSNNTFTRTWDAATGQELVIVEGSTQAAWNQDESKIMAVNIDNTVSIWDAILGQELVKLEGHTAFVNQAAWSKDGSKILTSSADNTARIWDTTTGQELVKLEGHTASVTQAIWNQDESKILTSSADGTVRIWYTQMHDLLVAGCQWALRNFTWNEWHLYMQDTQGDYRPICPNALVPPDAIIGIQNEVRKQIRVGQIICATQRLEQLNRWLQINGQFKNYGVDVKSFIAGANLTPMPSATPILRELGPLFRIQPPSPLPSPTVTPRATGTPVASTPVATPAQ